MGSIERTLIEEQPDDLPAELLALVGEPERVFYAPGVLLDAEDFGAETRYLRGRLARALVALFGYGTVAGLKVTLSAERRADFVELKVAPGLAIDRLGRLIEVRREQCLRLDEWLAWRAQVAAGDEPAKAQLLASMRSGSAGVELVVDVWLRFAVCAHGVTPAFAAGPFNATDYMVPARLADAFELTLQPALLDTAAPERPPIGPGTSLAELAAVRSPLPAEAGTAAEAWLDAHVFSAWPRPDPLAADRLLPLREHASAADWDKLLLARLAVPLVNAAVPPQLDATRIGPDWQPDNALRPLALNPMRWAGTVRAPV